MSYMYGMRQTNSEFFIRRRDVPKSLAGLLSKSVYDAHCLGATDFQGDMAGAMFDIFLNDNGDVDFIELTSEKIPDISIAVLEVLAPIVADGSFIELVGEDGSLFRWTFKGGKMKHVNAKIIWPE